MEESDDEKNIDPWSFEDWIRLPTKTIAGASMFWKALFKSFPLVRNGLAQRVGNGAKVR